VHRSDSLVSIDSMLREVSRRHHPQASPEEAELEYQRMLRGVFSIPVDELEIYRAECERDRTEDGIAAFFESFYVFELMPENPAGVRDVSSILERLLEFAVTERRATTLERVVCCVREFQSRPDLPRCSKGCRRRTGTPAVSWPTRSRSASPPSSRWCARCTAAARRSFTAAFATPS